MSDKRYTQYPNLAALVREMSPEGRELVAHWHRVLTTGLEGYRNHVPEEARQLAATPEERLIAVMAADAAVQGWLNTMRDVAGIIVDPAEGDWCCKRGMMASPDPCPQHDFDKRVLYDEGTIIEREYGEGTEKAVCVHVDTGLTQHWRSVRFSLEYTTAEVGQGRWKVVGRV